VVVLNSERRLVGPKRTKWQLKRDEGGVFGGFFEPRRSATHVLRRTVATARTITGGDIRPFTRVLRNLFRNATGGDADPRRPPLPLVESYQTARGRFALPDRPGAL
jgi:hypothetical protein